MNKQWFENKMCGKVLLFGNYRHCNDMKYVFSHVFGSHFDNIIYGECGDKIEDLKILSTQYDLIIICVKVVDWNKAKRFLRAENIVWMEELFVLLDQASVGWFDKENPSDEYHRVPENKQIALWGLNDACKFFLDYQQNIRPHCIIDRDSSKCGMYGDIPVILPDSIVNWTEYYVIVMCREKYIVRDFLASKELRESEDFIYYGYYIDRLCTSEMLRRTIYAPSKKRIDCEIPFNRATFQMDGTLNLCTCASILAGNVLHQNASMAWNSVAAVIIRLSMVNKTYSFCDWKVCQFFPKNFESAAAPPEDEYNHKAPIQPEILQLNCSGTCNLYCETCRECIWMEDALQEQRGMQIVKRILPLFQEAKEVWMAGYGEVFASKCYKYVLREMKKLHHDGLTWAIISNGILMNEQAVDYILTIGGVNTIISVSVDAASPETYKKIRRGGNWEKLMKNLEYIGQQRQEGRLAVFRLNFVVQSKNVQEMGKFVDLAKRLNANDVWFTRIQNWGTYSEKEFEQIDVMDEQDNIKEEYQEYFDDPVLKSSDVHFSALLTGEDADFQITSDREMVK